MYIYNIYIYICILQINLINTQSMIWQDPIHIGIWLWMPFWLALLCKWTCLEKGLIVNWTVFDIFWYVFIYAFILTLWRKAVELPQTVRTKSRTPHSNLHVWYFFRTFWTVVALHMGFGAQKISKKAMTAKRSFLSIAHPILQAWQDTRTRTTMLPHMVKWDNLWHRLTSNCTVEANMLSSVALPDTHKSFRTCCRHKKA